MGVQAKEKLKHIRQELVKLWLSLKTKHDKLSPDMFSKLLTDNMEHLGLEDKNILQKFKLPRKTLTRWKSGLRAPYLEMQKSVIKYLQNRALYLIGRNDLPEDHSGVFVCETCGSQIEPKQAQLALNRHRVPKYCSPTCWGKRKREYNYDHKFLDTDSEFSAYFTGFWVADGHLDKADAMAHISSSDLQIIEAFKQRTRYEKSDRGRQRKDKKREFTLSYAGNVSKQIQKMGYFPGPKSGFEFVPVRFMEEPWFHHFVRGFWDGDGSIGLTKTNHLTSYAVNMSKGVLEYILEYLYEHRIVRGGAIFKAKPTLWKLQFGHFDTVQLCHWMYQGATIKLDRKHQVYLVGKDTLQKYEPQTNLICSFPDCAREARTKGLCKKHFDKQYHRLYTVQNPEKIKEKDRKYRERNRERINEHRRRKYAENPEPHRAATQKWREENPEKVKEYKKQYQRKNPEKVRAQKRAYRNRNHEKVREQEKASYERNRENKLAKMREYKDKNREKINAQAAEYREKNREEVRRKDRERYQRKKVERLAKTNS
jgi:hypothetical protein